jgi:DNA invertase Pin-like site-specific DNA recombinase
METAGCWKIFREKLSGGNRDRPVFQRMLDQIRVGDSIVASKLDRLALHPVDRWRRTRGADTISSVSDQIFEFSQRLSRFSAPLLPNTQFR